MPLPKQVEVELSILEDPAAGLAIHIRFAGRVPVWRWLVGVAVTSVATAMAVVGVFSVVTVALAVQAGVWTMRSTPLRVRVRRLGRL